MNSTENIAVSGIGVLSPLGIGFEEFSPAFFEGEPPEANSESGTCRLPEYNIRDFVPTPKSYLDANSSAAMAAAALAMERSAFADKAIPGERIGMLMATSTGNHSTMIRFFNDALDKGPRLVKPVLFQHAYMNTSISLACMEWGWKGPHQLKAGAGPAALQCLIDGVDLLRDRAADVIFVGAADTLGALPVEKSDGGKARHPRPRQLAEGAVVLCLQRGDMAAPESADSAGRSLVFKGGSAGFAAPPQPLADRAVHLIHRALADAECDIGSLGGILLAASADPVIENALAEALRGLFPPSTPWIIPDILCGTAGSADGLLLVAAARAILDNKAFPPLTIPEGRPSREGEMPARDRAVPLDARSDLLLLAADPTGSITAVIVGR